MRYIQLLSSVLVLCFALTVSAYAAEPATVDPPANIPEDVPEWALRPALLADPSLFAAADETDSSLFLSKSFDEYTVTEGFLLLFLILGFCWLVWKIIKGVF